MERDKTSFDPEMLRESDVIQAVSETGDPGREAVSETGDPGREAVFETGDYQADMTLEVVVASNKKEEDNKKKKPKKKNYTHEEREELAQGKICFKCSCVAVARCGGRYYCEKHRPNS
jgi:hypothetical protein